MDPGLVFRRVPGNEEAGGRRCYRYGGAISHAALWHWSSDRKGKRRKKQPRGGIRVRRGSLCRESLVLCGRQLCIKKGYWKESEEKNPCTLIQKQGGEGGKGRYSGEGLGVSRAVVLEASHDTGGKKSLIRSQN